MLIDRIIPSPVPSVEIVDQREQIFADAGDGRSQICIFFELYAEHSFVGAEIGSIGLAVPDLFFISRRFYYVPVLIKERHDGRAASFLKYAKDGRAAVVCIKRLIVILEFVPDPSDTVCVS